MRSFIQFITTPTADTPGTALLLHFDNKRYLIGNISEGTQRAAVQRKLSLNKTGDILLTGPINWAGAGGILGMILTLADTNATSYDSKVEELIGKMRKRGNSEKEIAEMKVKEKQWLSIHGGRNLSHMLATARRFIFRKGMPLHINELVEKQGEKGKVEEPSWEDGNVKVWAMSVEPGGEMGEQTRRKRSHEEFSDDEVKETKSAEGGESEADQEARYTQMRKAVISDMFDSEWKLDALVKTKLSLVRMAGKSLGKIFRRDEGGKIVVYEGPTLEQDPTTPDIDVLVRNPWPAALIEALPPTTPSVSSVCYIIKNHTQRGKFNPAAAKKLGVTPGPDFRKLTMGESVTTASGKVVTPDEVLGASKEGCGVAIVDLPTESYIEPLLARKEFSTPEIMSSVEAIVWILGPGVVNNPKLLKFMQENTQFKHIVSSKDCCSNYLALESPASAAIRLHLVDPERFPLPKFKNEVPLQQVEGPLPYEKARIMKTLLLEPKFEIQDEKIVHYLDTKSVIKDMPEDVLVLAKAAQAEISTPEYLAELEKNQKDIPSKDAEVITLGTGSSVPSKYRNVSATLVRVPGYGSYLLDCGENTLGQLMRVFGNELPEVLRDLKVIWISHLHADHHLGTASVIKAWADETSRDATTKDNKLIVASDEGMLNWLKEYSEVEDYGYSRIQPISMARSTGLLHTFSPTETLAVGLTSIQACSVLHCHGALAVVLNFPNGFKLAYSGDCRPSHSFAQIGQGATLLIHEATFDDELIGDAKAKKHSTTGEAMGVGKEMGARRILLTHFSQRYQKIPVMDSHHGKGQTAILAWDYMRCRVGDMAKVEAFLPALGRLYEGVVEQ